MRAAPRLGEGGEGIGEGIDKTARRRGAKDEGKGQGREGREREGGDERKGKSEEEVEGRARQTERTRAKG